MEQCDGESDDSRGNDANTVAALRTVFYEALEQNKPEKSFILEKSKYEHYLQTLQGIRNPLQLQPGDRFTNQKRFGIKTEGGETFLVRAKTERRVFHKEQLFEVVFAAHRACGHGDGKRTYDILKDSTDNVYRWECLQLAKNCYCRRTRARIYKAKQWRSPQTNAGELDLLCMTDCPDNGYMWILLYRDSASQFLVARPIRSKYPDELAFELIHMFMAYGTPLFLDSSLRKAFIERVLKAIYCRWPECPTIYGKQLEVEKNSEYSRLLQQWLEENRSASWSVGLAFVSSTLNNQHNRKLGASPYKLLLAHTLTVAKKEFHAGIKPAYDSSDNDE